jgi:hypothetical protein
MLIFVGTKRAATTHIMAKKKKQKIDPYFILPYNDGTSLSGGGNVWANDSIQQLSGAGGDYSMTGSEELGMAGGGGGNALGIVNTALGAASSYGSQAMDANKPESFDRQGGMWTKAGETALSDMGTGASIGSVAGPWGTAIGAVAGGIEGFVRGAFEGREDERKFKAGMEDYYSDDAKKARGEQIAAYGGRLLGNGGPTNPYYKQHLDYYNKNKDVDFSKASFADGKLLQGKELEQWLKQARAGQNPGTFEYDMYDVDPSDLQIFQSASNPNTFLEKRLKAPSPYYPMPQLPTRGFENQEMGELAPHIPKTTGQEQAFRNTTYITRNPDGTKSTEYKLGHEPYSIKNPGDAKFELTGDSPSVYNLSGGPEGGIMDDNDIQAWRNKFSATKAYGGPTDPPTLAPGNAPNVASDYNSQFPISRKGGNGSVDGYSIRGFLTDKEIEDEWNIPSNVRKESIVNGESRWLPTGFSGEFPSPYIGNTTPASWTEPSLDRGLNDYSHAKGPSAREEFPLHYNAKEKERLNNISLSNMREGIQPHKGPSPREEFSNTFAYGGKTGGPSMDLGGEIDMISGPSHEGGGVQITEGTEVEGGEAKIGNEVLSDRLTNPLTGNTFAKDAEKIKKKYGMRSEDGPTKRAQDAEMRELISLNDKAREEQEAKEQAIAEDFNAYGGAIKLGSGGKIEIDPGMRKSITESAKGYGMNTMEYATKVYMCGGKIHSKKGLAYGGPYDLGNPELGNPFQQNQNFDLPIGEFSGAPTSVDLASRLGSGATSRFASTADNAAYQGQGVYGNPFQNPKVNMDLPTGQVSSDNYTDYFRESEGPPTKEELDAFLKENSANTGGSSEENKRKFGAEEFGAALSMLPAIGSTIASLNVDKPDYGEYTPEKFDLSQQRASQDRELAMARQNLSKGVRNIGGGLGSGAALSALASGNAALTEAGIKGDLESYSREGVQNTQNANEAKKINLASKNQEAADYMMNQMTAKGVRSQALADVASNLQGYMKDKKLSAENERQNKRLISIINNMSSNFDLSEEDNQFMIKFLPEALNQLNQ